MIDAIVYSSLSGSCEEYAQRMSAALHIPFFTEKSGLCPVGRKIAYIGWLFAGKVVGLDKAMDRYDVCCVVSVGMGDPAVNPAEVCRKKNGLGSDIAVFPLQGRFDLKRLPLPYRLIMKIKIKDIAKRLNAKAAKTTLTAGEQACLTMATLGHGEPATWDGINDAIAWDVAHSFHSKWRGYASALTDLLIGRARREQKDVVLECVPAQEATKRIAVKKGFHDCGISDGLAVYRLCGKNQNAGSS